MSKTSVHSTRKTKHRSAGSRAVSRRAPLLQSYNINTAAGVVEALGGDRAVARLFGVSLETVKKWVISGDIQPGWHLRLFGMVCALGKTISPCAFGLFEGDKAARGLMAAMMEREFATEASAHG